MQRWHVTLGLAGAAVLAAAIAPRLTPFGAPPPTPSPAPPPPAPSAPPVTVVESVHTSGHLRVTAGLDHDAVLLGAPEERFLTIEVSGPRGVGETTRRAVDLGVVLDASGSMTARGKIDYARRAARLLATAMDPGDVYSLVAFADDATTVVPATPVHTPAAVHRAIDRVVEGGGTNLYAGLERGAEEVRRGLRDGAVGRLIVLSDGNPTAGITDPDALVRQAAALASQGVSVSTVGLGLDYNEDLLARIADVGGGTYDYVDHPRELEGVFSDELDRVSSVVARDAVVTVRLAPGVEGLDVLGWDAERTADGWRVRLGDVEAGAQRKLVARVQVSGEAEGPVPVAEVTVDYHDLVDGRRARSLAAARAELTTDPSVARASRDPERALSAQRAWGAWFLDRSSRAYADGRVDEARQLARRSQHVLRRAAHELSAPQLAVDAENAARVGQVYDAYAPSSVEGRRAVKTTKEAFRDVAR